MGCLRTFVIGSKNLACRMLSVLVNQGHDVLGVLTRDDEPGMKVWLNELGHRSLAQEAQALGIPVRQGVSVNSEEMVGLLASLNLDALFCAFWPEILGERVLTLPRLGCFNLHTAFLPRNRGSFPLPWAIIEGEGYAGLTIHRMTRSCDAGPVVAQVKVDIAAAETGGSLYRKVTAEGAWLFAHMLPQIAAGLFTLTPQQPGAGSYHPRGYPYGGQIDSYWSERQVDRFRRALTFPPFEGVSPSPPACLEGRDGPAVRVMLGFDCDKPRGSFVVSDEGIAMACTILRSIEHTNKALKRYDIPATFFVCGQWLASMAHRFYPGIVNETFRLGQAPVEIGGHTYSHNVLKRISTRPDKEPISPKWAEQEYRKNTGIIGDMFGINAQSRGYRAPLGHYRGLQGEYRLLDRLKAAGARYISSDLRGRGDTLEAPLLLDDGTPRQPYRYANGLLEIPSHGWQDTAFLGLSKTSVDGAPKGYEAIMAYYDDLIGQAHQIAQEQQRDYFLGLVLHPLDMASWAEGEAFIGDLAEIVSNTGGSFCTYGDAWAHYEEGR